MPATFPRDQEALTTTTAPAVGPSREALTPTPTPSREDIRFTAAEAEWNSVPGGSTTSSSGRSLQSFAGYSTTDISVTTSPEDAILTRR